MESKPFDNVESQIGFCGIWCGSCPGGNGSILELTRRYEATVKKNQMERWAPKDFDFREFMKGLASLQKVPLCTGCLKGGGNSACAIRICAIKKQMTSCSQCDLLMSCKNFEILEKSKPNARNELGMKRNVNQRELVAKWKSELKNKFPHCLILCNPE